MSALLPSKHARTNESILGLGAILVRNLTEPLPFDELWNRIRGEDTPAAYRLSPNIGLQDFSLALTFLYAIGALKMDSDGLLRISAAATPQSE